MSNKIVSLIDYNGNIIYEDRFSSLPIKEDGIIVKSKEMFNDSEPCIIHRMYIIKRFFFDMDKYLDDLLEEGINEVSCDILPDWVREMLDIEDGTEKMLLKN